MPGNSKSIIKQLNDLGPEANKVSKQEFLKKLSSRRGRIKSLLLNQSFLAGIGNIYCDESLYQAGIHPLCSAQKIPREKQIRLHRAIRSILNSAITHGGSSVENYLNAEGRPGNVGQPIWKLDCSAVSNERRV